MFSLTPDADCLKRVAETRRRELKSRLAIGAFIAFTGWFLAPSIMPVLWLAAVVATQVADDRVFARIRARAAYWPSATYRWLLVLSVALNVAVYAAFGVYLWFAGGAGGQVFGMVMLAGGMLHVSVHMNEVRAFVVAAMIPYTLYFLGLPILQAIIDGMPTTALLSVGGALYMTHLAVTIRQGSKNTRVLKEAHALASAEAERASIASSAKSDFLATITHEIRTPMNAVISSGQFLDKTDLTTSQRGHVEMLLESSNILVALLNDVLDFSKIEARKMELAPAPMDVPACLRSVQQIWSERAEEAGSVVCLTVDESVPASLLIDPLRFRQIVFNLVSNAVKFTRSGTVDVRANWRASDGRLTIQVEDTGCGIPADRLDAIFDLFQQADARTTRQYGGTGLGLAISRRLAELMGGSLEVTSEVGRGSCFTISIPAPACEAANEAVEVDQPVGSIAGMKILIAEDHPVNRMILLHLLEPCGADLTFAENGQIAVDLCASNRFDVILMDMQMPVMDGIEASRQIAARDLGHGAPIVAVTANAMDSHRAEWEAVGAAGFIAKPIDHRLLLTTLSGFRPDPTDASRTAA